MSLTKEDLAILRAPFPDDTLGVKPQAFNREKTKAMLVCYLQHTDVYNRLEEVDPAWSMGVLGSEKTTDGVVARVFLVLKGVSRENAGEGQDLKSAISDAIKRAAMLFGVGRYLYDSELVWIPYDEHQDKYRSYTYRDYQFALDKVKKAPPVRPEQPGVEDGVQELVGGYRIPFGKFAKKALEEVDVGQLGGYVLWMEKKAYDDKKPLSEMQQDFVNRASQYLESLDRKNADVVL